MNGNSRDGREMTLCNVNKSMCTCKISSLTAVWIDIEFKSNQIIVVERFMGTMKLESWAQYNNYSCKSSSSSSDFTLLKRWKVIKREIRMLYIFMALIEISGLKINNISENEQLVVCMWIKMELSHPNGQTLALKNWSRRLKLELLY